MISADALILLSDIDGLYSADPRRDAKARFIAEIREITPEIEAMAGEAPPGYSSGGMVTKLAAARIAVGAGCRMAIANGRRLNPLKAIAEGAACSWFLPAATPLSARKRWIAGALKPIGALMVDAGALKALMGGRSLLPGRRHLGGRRVRARRRRARTEPRRARGGARLERLFGRRRPPDHAAQKR